MLLSAGEQTAVQEQKQVAQSLYLILLNIHEGFIVCDTSKGVCLLVWGGKYLKQQKLLEFKANVQCHTKYLGPLQKCIFVGENKSLQTLCVGLSFF